MIDIKTIVEGLVLFTTIVGAWFVLKSNVDHLKGENESQWTVITKLRDWQDRHQMESAQTRLDIEKELGRIRENAGKIEIQISEVLRLVKGLDQRLERWIDKHNE